MHPVGGADSRVHDDRHHFACQAVMQGIDLPTLKCFGGWKTLRIGERYAAVSTDHLAASVARLR